MATKQLFLGSVGPLLYNDADIYEDGVTHKGLRTNGFVQADGGFIIGSKLITVVDSPYTLVTEKILLANAVDGVITVNLPTVVGETGVVHYFKKVDFSQNTIIIAPNGTETIDNEVQYTIVNPKQVVLLFSDGTNWILL